MENQTSGNRKGDNMDQGIKQSERPEKMGFETPYFMFTNCRVCGTRMYVRVQNLGKICPDCDPEQWEESQEG